ncbi:hypothetical protein CRG98_022380 [Punica granatum]|uniref:Uncharacterized protein n=1 Tax=Punica granatum TaxID=22663 RepID=A0A2I0JLQ6_PUNGR|nr:hypothetical protein CRG98_022380 [Punica granatum]
MKTSSKCINEEEPNALMKVECWNGIVGLIFLQKRRQVAWRKKPRRWGGIGQGAATLGQPLLGKFVANFVCRCFVRPVSGYAFPMKGRRILLSRAIGAHACGPRRDEIQSRRCTHARAYAMRLESVHLPEDARRRHRKRSRHYLFTTRRSRADELLESRGMGYT